MHNHFVHKCLYVSIIILFQEKCKMSTAAYISEDRNLNYDQLIALKKEGKIVLIDIREPSELQETGILPDAHSIPLGQVEEALQLQPDQFQKQYGFIKPTYDSELVFSCRSGTRSLRAIQIALAQGYDNAKHYAGGWLDWERHMNNTISS